jgi:hypothetical protein
MSNGSLEKSLRTRFWRDIRRGYVKNAELDPAHTQISILLADDEICVVRITAKNGVEYYLTNTRIISTENEPTTLMWYQDVVNLEWITDNSDWEEKTRLKIYDYDRVFLKDKAGNQISLSELDQAAFPLMKFFQRVIARNTNTQE